MTQVAKIEKRSAEVVSVESSLLEVIAKAARDPAVDMDKMERLLAMQERVQTRGAEIAFSQALATMQPQLPTIKKNGQIEHSGKKISDFAEWSDISKAISPILSAHGFSLSFKPSNDGKPAVTAILRHEAGHKDECTLELPLDTSGAKNAVQAVGSSLTYGKRYAAVLLLNITVEGEDDDGSSAAPKTIVQAPRDRAFPLGPAKNKTDLKNKIHAAWLEIDECGDADQFVPLLAVHDQLFKQLEAADDEGHLRGWYHGAGDNPGLKNRIRDRKLELGV
jgi:hypothetical protein